MRHVIAIGILTAISVSPVRSDACEMVSIPGLPQDGVTLATGVVVGYGTVARPTAAIESAPSLRVRIDTVVNGNIAVGDTDIVPLFYAPDCQSIATERARLESSFPTGVAVAVSTGAVPNESAARAIAAELNQGQFVVTVPSTAPRTRDGDLDFLRLSPTGLFAEFEFYRAVVGLRRARRPDKFRRILNLAHYDEFRNDSRGRELLERLIAESGLSASQRADVMKAAQINR